MFNLKIPFNVRQFILRGRKIRNEIDSELAYHLELLIEENIAAGMSYEEAKQAAVNRFGNLKSVNDMCLEIQTSRADRWFQDIGYAFQMICGKPLFTFLSILTLSISIAATIAIFNVANTVLWQPLPFNASDKLVVVQEENVYGNKVDTSNLNFLDLRAKSQSFEYIAAYSAGSATVKGGNEPTRSNVAWVSRDFFSVLGVEPVAGSLLLPEHHHLEADPLVIVSYRFWQNHLNSDRNLADRKLIIHGKSYTVAGILPSGVGFPFETDLWMPREVFEDTSERSAHNLKVIARVKNRVALSQIQIELSSISNQLEKEYPDSNTNLRITAIPLQSYLTANLRSSLIMLFIAVGVVLFIACANVTNLLLIRDEGRQEQIVSRIKLGASRLRIFRQLIIECILLSLLSALIGLAWSLLIASIIFEFLSYSIFEVGDMNITGEVLAFGIGISILIGLLCGLIPALRLSWINTTEPHIEEQQNESGYLPFWRCLIVAAELGMTMVLIFSAGLLVQNFWHLWSVNPGFKPSNVLTAQVSLPSSDYREPADRRAFYREALHRIQGIQRVQFAGIINNLPFGGEPYINGTFYIEERPEQKNGAAFSLTSPDYFQSLAIPLAKGRLFTEQDNEHSAPVAIITRELARNIFPAEDAIGKRIRFIGMDSESEVWMTIIGIVNDIKHKSLDLDSYPEVFIPYSQRPFKTQQMTIVIRTMDEPDGAITEIRRAIQSLDKDLPVNFGTMSKMFSQSLRQQRHQTILLILFAFGSMFFCLTGFYIVMRYDVARYVMGIKKVANARKHNVIMYSITKGVIVGVIGIMIGSTVVFTISSVKPDLILGIRATVPLVFLVSSVVILSSVLITSYVTARMQSYRII